MARKSKWETHVKPYIMSIEAWARSGLLDKDIASKLNVAYSTFRTYVKQHTELEEALQTSKEIANAAVESKLYQRACGYNYEEVRTKEEGEKVTEVTTITRHVVPDITAQKFWLMNREPDRWKEKQDVNLSGTVGSPELAEMQKYMEELWNAKE